VYDNQFCVTIPSSTPSQCCIQAALQPVESGFRAGRVRFYSRKHVAAFPKMSPSMEDKKHDKGIAFENFIMVEWMSIGESVKRE
jgi:hypothetical protein